MRRTIFILSAMACLTMLTPAHAQTATFNRFAIGMTLSNAKATDLGAGKYGSISIRCTDDAVHPSGLRLDAFDQSTGIVRCWPTQYIGSSLVRASIDLGNDVSATVEMSFRDDKLFQIETVYDYLHFQAISDGLTAKYGKPAAAKEGEVRNSVGGVFQQTTKTWAVGTSRISYSAPFFNTKRMLVLYEDAATADQIAKARREFEAKGLAL